MIVTLASQISAAPPAQQISVSCLAHTAIPILSTASNFFGGSSNASVTASPIVDADVAYLLVKNTASGLSTSAVAKAESTATAQQETSAAVNEMLKHPRIYTPERMTVGVASLDVPLGSPITVTVKLAPGELFGEVGVLQMAHGAVVFQSDKPSRIVSDEGSTKVIEIVPAELGAVDLEVYINYADNALAEQTIHLNVLPSSKGLTKFGLGIGPLVLEDKEEDRQEWLMPLAHYESLKYDLHLWDTSLIPMTVEQPEDDPVIRVDKNGLVHALREGKAVIVVDFDGYKSRTEVDVYSKEDAPVGYRRVHDPE